MKDKPELVIDARAPLAEGPCWDEKEQLLYWVDILEKKVNIYDPNLGTGKTFDTGQYTGAVVLRETGGAVAALTNGFYFMDTGTGRLEQIVDPESHLPGNRFNDGKCDAAGRFWAGTAHIDETMPTGSLYVLDTDLSTRAVLGGIIISNGIAWSPDNKTMYYIDSPTRQIAAFDFDLKTGNLSNRRTSVVIPEGMGLPDGMTIDAEGMIWVAIWEGWQVSRWNPHTGKLLQSVHVPASMVTSCAFGGKNLDELYITTARRNLDEKALQNQPHAGGIFKVGLPVGGFAAYRFGG